MTNYYLKPPDTLPALAWQEAKAKRKKLLAEVRQRRKIIHQRFHKKMQERRSLVRS